MKHQLTNDTNQAIIIKPGETIEVDIAVEYRRIMSQRKPVYTILEIDPNG